MFHLFGHQAYVFENAILRLQNGNCKSTEYNSDKINKKIDQSTKCDVKWLILFQATAH